MAFHAITWKLLYRERGDAAEREGVSEVSYCEACY